ncbi:MAG: hypothetical protein ACTSXA_11430 [Candidatus Heimdallarchaeota archaeon]
MTWRYDLVFNNQLNGFLDSLKDIPSHLDTIIKNAIAYLIVLLFALGIILAIVGAIKWATGWDERSGKKTIVKGLVLVAISLVSGGLGIGVSVLVG